MTEFERALTEALRCIAKGLESVSTSIDNAPTNATEISEAGNAVERGLADLATAVGSLEVK